jgi:hypothetical protein
MACSAPLLTRHNGNALTHIAGRGRTLPGGPSANIGARDGSDAFTAGVARGDERGVIDARRLRATDVLFGEVFGWPRQAIAATSRNSQRVIDAATGESESGPN